MSLDSLPNTTKSTLSLLRMLIAPLAKISALWVAKAKGSSITRSTLLAKAISVLANLSKTLISPRSVK